jgi:hypothetical protein
MLRDPVPVLSKGFRPGGVCVCVGFLFLVRCQGFRVVCVYYAVRPRGIVSPCSLWELGRRRCLRLPIWRPCQPSCSDVARVAPPCLDWALLPVCSFQKVVNALEQGSVAVEGEFRRLVHYVDDLVDGRRAIRDDWGGWSTSASAIAACIATSSAWLAVSPSGCVPVDCSHAVPVVRCVHRRA